MDRPVRKFAAAALLCLGPLVAGCMPDTPQTAFSWNVDDSLKAQHRPAPSPPRTYVYEDGDYDNSAPAAPPVPTPRPSRFAGNTGPAPSTNYHGGAITFAWPVNGDVISGFGSTQGGERNDGINIATRMDAPIRAAAAGTVNYAGDELKGYGNLVLIRHEDGFVTAYAHADRLLVNRGDVVSKGQVIGYAGKTGDVNSPQLHFEIRRDTTPIDPRTLLSARAGA